MSTVLVISFDLHIPYTAHFSIFLTTILKQTCFVWKET